MMADGSRPGPALAALSSLTGRRWKLGPARNKVSVERDVAVRTRDGAVLLADHYAPITSGPRPTVLMRCPYGRGLAWAMPALLYAERGYHVLLQSCRGTSGSGGTFRPYADEADDGQDTVGWLRGQNWFDGRLATVGASYLAYVQWALTLDPPPELKAMVVQVSPHDLGAACFGHGPFELYNRLAWSEMMAHHEQQGLVRWVWRVLRAGKRLAPMLSTLPLTATGAAIGGAGAPWYAEWLAHPDLADPYWDHRRTAAALERVTVPTLLISGFYDLFAEQTMQQYQTLRRRGVQAALTVGPWSHITVDGGIATRETLAWLDAFAAGDGPTPRPQPVRAWISGSEQWQELAQWPPAGAGCWPRPYRCPTSAAITAAPAASASRSPACRTCSSPATGSGCRCPAARSPGTRATSAPPGTPSPAHRPRRSATAYSTVARGRRPSRCRCWRPAARPVKAASVTVTALGRRRLLCERR
jgi:putative CocE/NonD family hydrolase